MLTPFPQAGASINGAETLSQPPRLGADIAAFVGASWRSIVLCMAIFLAAALVYLATTPPTFIAKGQLLIASDQQRTTSAEGGGGGGGGATDEAHIESQIEIIKSMPVAVAVVQKLRLINDPGFSKESVSLFQKAREAMGGKASPQSKTAEGRVVETLRDRLLVRRVGQSWVVEVSFPYEDPIMAARIVNAVAEAFINQDIEVKSQAASRANQWLTERVVALREQYNEALRAVLRYKLEVERAVSGNQSSNRVTELESIAQSYRKLYETYLLRQNETAQKVSYPEADARFVSIAAVPLDKSHPRGSLILAFAVMAGLVVGTAFSSIRYASDRRVRSTHQLMNQTGISSLGSIARLPSRFKKPSRGQGSNGPKIGVDAPDSFTSEIRSLKAAIHAVIPGHRSRCLGVVACAGGEGASTIAINLALLSAASGTNTLLIDACLDHPTVSETFAPRAQIGLMQTLDDEDLAIRLPVALVGEKFAVLPTGKSDGSVTPGDRISSDKTALQIESLRKSFNLIIFDLPALASSPDALSIAPYLDGVIVVGEFAGTTLDSIAAAAAALQSTRANLLGVVLTNGPVEKKMKRIASKKRVPFFLKVKKIKDKKTQTVINTAPLVFNSRTHASPGEEKPSIANGAVFSNLNEKTPLVSNGAAFVSFNEKASSIANGEASVDLSKKAPAVASREAPASLNRKAPATANKEASANLNRKAPVVLKKEPPSIVANELPVVVNEKIPSVAASEAPAIVNEEIPSAVASEAPAAVNEEIPSAVASEAPAAVNEEIPSAVASEAPAAVNEEIPSAVASEAPAAVNEEAPPIAASEAPAAMNEEAPPIAASEAPAAVNEEIPSAVASEAPAAVNEEIPSVAASEAPAAVNEEIPSVAASEAPAAVNEEAPPIAASEAPNEEAFLIVNGETASRDATSMESGDSSLNLNEETLLTANDFASSSLYENSRSMRKGRASMKRNKTSARA